MTVMKALATVVGFSLLFALVGTTAGGMVGSLAPEYYRSVVWRGRETGFEPVSYGVGSGLTQGLAAGFAAGLIVVALLCWRDICDGPAVGPVPVPAKSGSTTRKILLVTGFLISLGFCTCSGAAVGLLGGELGAYYRRYLADKDRISPLLAADPAFADVDVQGNLAGEAFLTGKVPTDADRSRLLSVIGQAVGQQRARDMLIAVDVVGK